MNIDSDFEWSEDSLPVVSETTVQKKKRKQYRPKVQREWTYDEIVKLIKLIEERRVLWDKGMAGYKLPKILIWQEIADDFGIFTPEECKAKWNNLRVTFNTNLTKYRSTKSGQSLMEKPQITWKYFNFMLFLESVYVNQFNESTSVMQLDSAVTENPIKNDCGISTGLMATSQENSFEEPTLKKIMLSVPPPSQSQQDSSSFKELSAQSLNKISNQPTNDEFRIFGEFVASELRSIPIDRARYIKRKLNRNLLDLMDEIELMPPPRPQQKLNKTYDSVAHK